ncbi:MAG: 23S rRNA (pseudouridine(1915)-N(3))-methyltransferase RlmH [Synechococcales bacterium]|nr:23S rRNA (pseudouridine(1915)-N(3))-methyltransferase RlmH [Synechococcales bacterium]
MQRKIQIVAVGKVKYAWINAGIQEYLKRLPGMEVVEIKDSGRKTEWSEVQSYVKSRDRLIVLTERGSCLSSEQFAESLAQWGQDCNLVFAIGSADGIAPSLEQAADRRLALSPMTFTHDMARLLLIEQIYRAINILNHGNYHK